MVTTSICDVLDYVTSAPICPKPAVAAVEIICKHEHVSRRSVCYEHGRQIALASSNARCRLCADHPTRPHECAIISTRTDPL